jgi:long-chain acyl-CoA synthetase
MALVTELQQALARAADEPVLYEVRGEQLSACTGHQLLARQRALLAGLRSRGIAPGDRVVLLAHNSLDWVAADMAILAAGALVVPLYTRQSPSELRAMVQDCAPRLIVTDELALAQEIAGSCPVVALSSLGQEPSEELPPPDNDDRRILTLVYTSGTTSSVARGVQLSEGGVHFVLSATSQALDALMAKV